jgi:hypothetical protein
VRSSSSLAFPDDQVERALTFYIFFHLLYLKTNKQTNKQPTPQVGGAEQRIRAKGDHQRASGKSKGKKKKSQHGDDEGDDDDDDDDDDDGDDDRMHDTESADPYEDADGAAGHAPFSLSGQAGFNNKSNHYGAAPGDSTPAAREKVFYYKNCQN